MDFMMELGPPLPPLVPSECLSDEPYLLSKRCHLDSINLAQLLWTSAAESISACPVRALLLLPA